MTFDNIKNNILASLVVFLVAIPLCLGIALASGAPLFSGIITGCIGGVIVGLISASRVSVSGPAAGMVAVVLTAVSQLGSFTAFLLALFLAGLLQILSGVSRAGFIANYVPSTVVKGLLAAIGISIVIKQIPLALGYSAHKAMVNAIEENADMSYLPHLMSHINSGAIVISIISLAILIFWDKLPIKKLKVIPAAFVVVLCGIIINAFYAHFIPALFLQETHLVNIPIINNFSEFVGQFQHPDFSALTNQKVYLYAVMIAVVASLETLLNLEAIEKIDKRHRYCSRDRELVAQGVGNVLSSLVGGLPITSVIVRSSVNINAGGSSKLSTVLHGLLLLTSLTLMASWLNYIPISALAAILIYTGCKLARLSLFAEVYKEGLRYFIPFLITIIAILCSNLLLGILIGLATSVLFILQHNSKNCFSVIDEKHPSGDILRMVLPQQVTFLNRAGIVDGLNSIPRHTKVVLDATATDYIDEDIIDLLKETTHSLQAEKNILFNLEGFQEHYDLRQTKSFIQATTYDVQASLTPAKVLTLLREGNSRFMKNTPIHRNYKQEMAQTAVSQHPIAVILSCIDSRVPVELIFNLSLGDVFVVRIAGNIANEDILGSIEFACKAAEAKLIVVLGHKGCGAIKAACEHVELGHLTQLIEKIQPAIDMEMQNLDTQLTTSSEQFLLNVTRNNVQLTKNWLLEHSTILRDLIGAEKIALVGAIYDLGTGEVSFDRE